MRPATNALRLTGARSVRLGRRLPVASRRLDSELPRSSSAAATAFPLHPTRAVSCSLPVRCYATEASRRDEPAGAAGLESTNIESSVKGPASDSAFFNASRSSRSSSTSTETYAPTQPSAPPRSGSSTPPPDDWEENPNWNISNFSELPHTNFGVNQHMIINDEFKEALRQILWQFRAPIRYAFAYGSGVFPQSKPDGRVPTDEEIRRVHAKAPASVQRAQDGTPKMIDFIFGVTFTQHWHSLNLNQHRDHYSKLGALGSGAVSFVQDRWGAGVYFNPYVVVNGILIKYGVVNLDTLKRDLSEWDTLYLAGRLHKPVKILRDDAQVRLANQMNLLSALRTALLLLPPSFTEHELYSTIAGISYLGDPRMALPTENPQKVSNIVGHNLPNFRRLYAPLIANMPNVEFDSSAAMSSRAWLTDPMASLSLRQDMDPVKRGNMVRRLPKAFRSKLYFKYQEKFAIPQVDFDRMMAESSAEGGESAPFRRQQGGGFEQRIAQDEPAELRGYVRDVIRQTINWPSTSQSLKSSLTAGVSRTVRYLGEKMAKYREGKAKMSPADKGPGREKADKKEDHAESEQERKP